MFEFKEDVELRLILGFLSKLNCLVTMVKCTRFKIDLIVELTILDVSEDLKESKTFFDFLISSVSSFDSSKSISVCVDDEIDFVSILLVSVYLFFIFFFDLRFFCLFFS